MITKEKFECVLVGHDWDHWGYSCKKIKSSHSFSFGFFLLDSSNAYEIVGWKRKCKRCGKKEFSDKTPDGVG